ncbi:MAG: type IV pilus modification protein PilV [Gammaproteobacteria bacterium]|nr:type IV pilus modification protein PilV [Gammaproteobacteria bacterium]
MPIKNNKLINNRISRSVVQGFTLMEVLVAVIVLSIGLLGLASLQAVGLRNNQSALLRSQSTVLAYEAVDRMRANRSAALNGNYNTDFSTSALTCVSNPTLSGTIAQIDLIQWKNSLACSLPSGDGKIERGTGNLFTISVRWDDSRGQQSAQIFTVTTQL